MKHHPLGTYLLFELGRAPVKYPCLLLLCWDEHADGSICMDVHWYNVALGVIIVHMLTS